VKDMDPDRLPHALRGVLAGEAALPRSLVSRVLAEFSRAGGGTADPSPSPLAQLTPRERAVLELLRQGLTTDQVARQLTVSPVTVRSYVSTSLKKLRVRDRESAMRLLDRD
jgi:DNA-binding NarL/FixJ family response regulator